MENSNLAKLAAANFALNRTLLQLQSAQATCKMTTLKSCIAAQTTNLALTHYQQAQVSLALEIARSQSTKGTSP